MKRTGVLYDFDGTAIEFAVSHRRSNGFQIVTSNFDIGDCSIFLLPYLGEELVEITVDPATETVAVVGEGFKATKLVIEYGTQTNDLKVAVHQL